MLIFPEYGTFTSAAGGEFPPITNGELNCVTTDDTLLARFESSSFASTITVFVIGPGAVGTILIVAVAVEPGASVPILQITAFFPKQNPWLVANALSAAPSGKSRLSTTPVALFGPLLDTEAVYD